MSDNNQRLKKINELYANLQDTWAVLHLDIVAEEIEKLKEATLATDFWTNNLKAQEVTKHLSQLETKYRPWEALMKNIEETQSLIALQDPSLDNELDKNFKILISTYDQLKEELKFIEPYDGYDALISIYSGAGGTDAQDWVQMLLRMYVRFSEISGFNVRFIEESAGDEAGLKSVSFEVEGINAYGILKAEHGVHRLVRLSPFNADNLRQTSFAKVEVMPKIDKPDTLMIDDKDLRIDVFRAGGHGGQSVNTTDSAVRITHIPTGIVVSIQNERSQIQNKETAMTILRSKLIALQLEQHADRVSDLKGPNQSAEWGNQIRSYVLHPYKMVKDLRTKHETSDIEAVLDGDISAFIDAYLDQVPLQSSMQKRRSESE